MSHLARGPRRGIDSRVKVAGHRSDEVFIAAAENEVAT
jgi:hypothetical protein